ncbi:MAG: FecR domain-containing protein [Deltaproteobacteria bacterium]|nr:FecR domain-containing protein [Deltaproteobacteria bacterium]
MKKTVCVSLIIVAMSVFIGFQHADARTPAKLKVGQDGAQVAFLIGKVQAISPGDKNWRFLRLDDVLKRDDEVATGEDSRLELIMSDGSRVRFAEKTRFILQQSDFDIQKKEGRVRFHLSIGRCWANIVRAIKGKSVFELSCNNAVAGVRGTIYRMNVNEDESALVKVYKGRVEVSKWTGMPSGEPLSSGPPKKVAGPTPIPGPHKVSMEEWTYIVKSMQQIRINADGIPEKPEEFDPEEDMNEWVRWNQSRDGVEDVQKDRREESLTGDE